MQPFSAESNGVIEAKTKSPSIYDSLSRTQAQQLPSREPSSEDIAPATIVEAKMKSYDVDQRFVKTSTIEVIDQEQSRHSKVFDDEKFVDQKLNAIENHI